MGGEGVGERMAVSLCTVLLSPHSATPVSSMCACVLASRPQWQKPVALLLQIILFVELVHWGQQYNQYKNVTSVGAIHHDMDLSIMYLWAGFQVSRTSEYRLDALYVQLLTVAVSLISQLEHATKWVPFLTPKQKRHC